MKQPRTRGAGGYPVKLSAMVVSYGGDSGDLINKVAQNTNVGFKLSQLTLSSAKQAPITV